VAVVEFDADGLADAGTGGGENRLAVLVTHEREAAVQDRVDGIALQQLRGLVDLALTIHQQVVAVTLQASAQLVRLSPGSGSASSWL